MGVVLDTPIPKPQENPIRKVTYDQAKDEVTATMPAATFEEAKNSMEFRQRAMVEMQKEADRIGAQEQVARSRNPIIGAIQQVSAHLSQQKDMPGFVQGLGQASMAMNPTADSLAAQKLPLYMQLAKMEQEQQDSQRADKALEVQAMSAMGNLQGKALARDDRLATGLDSVTRDLEKLAKDRIDLSPEDIAKRLRLRGIEDPEQATSLSEYYSKLRTAANAAYDEARRDKLSDREAAAKVNLALQTVLAERANERYIARSKELTAFRQNATLGRQKEMAEFSAATKDLEPFRRITPPQQTVLNDMTTNLEYIKSLRQVVNDPKTGQYLGPLNLARISGEWSTLFRPEELQTVMTYFAHELPRVAKFTGAQSRAFTAAMVPVVKSLGGETSMTRAQMNKVIDIIEESTQQLQVGIAKSKPLARFDLAPGMLGGVASPAYRAWVDAHETALKRGGGGDDAAKAKSAAIGEIVSIGDKMYRKTGANNFDPIGGGD